ncbi:helicase, partial [Pseudomonas aeruginosa]|nr:helicase [Pseudomonas aeruginosa]
MTSPSAPDTQLSLAIDPARPYARLTLGSHVHSGYDLRSGRMQSISRHRAALAFIYAGEAVSGRPGSEPREAQRRIERRPAHEQEYRETLRRLGFKPATRRSDALEESAGEMFELPGDNAWLHFMQDDLPRLRQQGWFIDIRADFAYDLTPIDAWYAEVEEADDRQWFELELGIQVAGQRVS